MSQEIRICQNCKQQFVIEAEGFDFYDKIETPSPTWCWECRMIRKMMFRNERTWYRRRCDATGQNILSMFSPDKPLKVYAENYWRSDAWDPLEYGREYDFSKTFFQQFKELFYAIPHANLIQKNLVNSEYANYALNLKDCYYVVSADTAEDCGYLFGRVLRSRDYFDFHQSVDNETCYELIDCEKSNKVCFAQHAVGSVDSRFLYDCRNCINCFGCVGLRNKQYYIFNEPYAKDEYIKKLTSLDTGSYRNLLEIKKRFDVLKLRVPRKYAAILKSENVVGDDILNSRNCYYCFNTRNDIENCRYSFGVHERSKDGHDAIIAWNAAELFYEVLSIYGRNIKFSAFIWGGFDVEYSYNCFDCNNIFGCIGLRNKSYCILNKQYTKESYSDLRIRIIEHMNSKSYVDEKDRLYKYGEFFPPELSPFAYNETIAQEYYPKTREQIIAEGYGWKEQETKHYQITKQPEELSDHIKNVPDSITDDVIGCAHGGVCNEQCATAFRIVPHELQFYRKMNLPLPRLCPSCRHAARLKLKNPLKLWHRACQCAGVQSENSSHKNTAVHPHGHSHCPTEFETPYSPERKEIIYCEACYNAEVV